MALACSTIDMHSLAQREFLETTLTAITRANSHGTIVMDVSKLPQRICDCYA